MDFPRQLSTLETVSIKKRLHERLSNHTKNHEIVNIHDSISDRAEFERRLRQYLYRRNKSELMGSIRKIDNSPGKKHHRGVSLDGRYGGAATGPGSSASVPSWMRNSKRIVGLPNIEVSRAGKLDSLDALDITVESGTKVLTKRRLLVQKPKP